MPSVSSQIVSRRVDGSLSDRPPPVFLHSSFRTGSTWLWQKLRSAPTTLAYYECFHEYLATLTPRQAKDVNSFVWDSRHPPGAPYFLEYLPIIEPEGGIAGFDQSIPYRHFVPRTGADGDLEPVDKAHVDRLVSAAWSKMRIPVLTCTRSLGRARALRRSFGGKSIFLHRNLFHQWASYCWQAEAQNTFFIDTIRCTINGSAHDPFLRGVSEWFGLEDPDVVPERLFQAFVLLHLYLYAIAFDAADLTVDLEEIAKDRYARGQVEHELSEMIRYDVDLSDARVQPCEYTDLVIASPRATRDTIEQFAKLIPTASLSPAAIMFVGDAKDSALAEWERFEFYSRRTRVVLTGKIHTAEARAREQETITASLRAERDEALAKAGQAETNANQAQATAAETSVQRDALREEAAAAKAICDELATALAQAKTDASRAETNASEASVQRDALREEAAAAKAICDELATALAQAKTDASRAETNASEASAQREAFRKEVAAATGTRDELATALAQAKTDASRAETNASEASAQRDALREEVAAATATRDALEIALAEVQAKGRPAAPLSRLARKLLGRSGG